eukprot:scaffold55166_cov30-Tisochrysis_lutea.AAC.3
MPSAALAEPMDSEWMKTAAGRGKPAPQAHVHDRLCWLHDYAAAHHGANVPLVGGALPLYRWQDVRLRRRWDTGLSTLTLLLLPTRATGLTAPLSLSQAAAALSPHRTTYRRPRCSISSPRSRSRTTRAASEAFTHKARAAPSSVRNDAPSAALRFAAHRLKGALVFNEGQQNDTRMNVHIALTAAQEGATVANHTEVLDLLSTGTRGQSDYKIVGAKVRDVFTGETYEIKAKQVG